MAHSLPVRFFVADADASRRRQLQAAIDEVRGPDDEVVSVDPGDLVTSFTSQRRQLEPAVVFLSADDEDHVRIAEQLKVEGPESRVFVVALVDPDDQGLLSKAYQAGLNACVPRGDPDETVDRVRRAATFALAVPKL